jgi:hypothetical protein
MSIRESLDAWTTLTGLVTGMPLDDEIRAGYHRHLEELLPKMIEGLQAEVQRIIDGPKATRTAAAPAPAPAPAEPLAADYSYDDWAAFAEREGKNPADFVRTWFRDVEGGFDASTAAQRVDQWAKAKAWVAAQKARETQERPRVMNGGQGRQGGQQGGQRRQNTGPCPDCDQSRRVTTKYGERWRCDDHDYWGKAG